MYKVYSNETNKDSAKEKDDKEKDDKQAIDNSNNFCRIAVSTVSNKIYSVYLNDDISEPYNYCDIFNILRTADVDDEIHIYINSDGGYLSTVYQFVSAIRQCKATIISYIDGAAHSAASMIFLACNSCAIPEHCAMMVHFFSGAAIGKGHEIKSRVKFEDDFIKDFYRDIYKGFLTDDELERVFKGEDLWLDAKEINKRLNKKFKTLSVEHKNNSPTKKK